jgi:uncharacterized membrane protein YecN with MAPEG domain
MNHLVLTCIALLGILLFLLGANVTRHRVARGRSGGAQASTDPTDDLFVAVRAHGNAAEYVPTLAVLLLICSQVTDGWWLDVLAITAVVARVGHAVGLLASGSLAKRSPVKDAGALLTYATGTALGITLIASL